MRWNFLWDNFFWKDFLWNDFFMGRFFMGWFFMGRFLWDGIFCGMIFLWDDFLWDDFLWEDCFMGWIFMGWNFLWKDFFMGWNFLWDGIFYGMELFILFNKSCQLFFPYLFCVKWEGENAKKKKNTLTSFSLLELVALEELFNLRGLVLRDEIAENGLQSTGEERRMQMLLQSAPVQLHPLPGAFPAVHTVTAPRQHVENILRPNVLLHGDEKTKRKIFFSYFSSNVAKNSTKIQQKFNKNSTKKFKKIQKKFKKNFKKNLKKFKKLF